MSRTSPEPSQLQKFKEAARKAEADEDEAVWEARLKKVAKHKPVAGKMNR